MISQALSDEGFFFAGHTTHDSLVSHFVGWVLARQHDEEIDAPEVRGGGDLSLVWSLVNMRVAAW